MGTVVWPCHWSIHHNFQEVRGLDRLLVEILEDLYHQVVQNCLHSVRAELRILQPGVRAAPALLAKDSHPHRAPAWAVVHVEQDVHFGRRPVIKALGALKPVRAKRRSTHPRCPMLS